jgi:hypothetical protein
MLVLLALVIGLLAGPWQAPAEAEMLGRAAQFKNLTYAAPDWKQTNPDGSQSVFTLAPGQSFIMTEIRVRFYVSNTGTETGPYRFFLLGPGESMMYLTGLNDIMYPGSQTVWGGTMSETNLIPGVAFSVLPTPKVKQLPPPPTNPNEGTVRTGTFYITLRGYTIP